MTVAERESRHRIQGYQMNNIIAEYMGWTEIEYNKGKIVHYIEDVYVNVPSPENGRNIKHINLFIGGSIGIPPKIKTSDNDITLVNKQIVTNYSIDENIIPVINKIFEDGFENKYFNVIMRDSTKNYKTFGQLFLTVTDYEKFVAAYKTILEINRNKTKESISTPDIVADTPIIVNQPTITEIKVSENTEVKPLSDKFPWE